MIRCDDAVDPDTRRTLTRWIDRGVLAGAELRYQLDSTNSYCLRYLSTGGPDFGALPWVVIAEEQSAGRGRQGKVWLSQAGNLTMSWMDIRYTPLMSVAIGIAVARAIESVVPPSRCGLKWPNDVWLAGRKVAGILIEGFASDPRISVIGVGVNLVHHPSRDHCKHEAVEPTSIQAATGRMISVAELLDELLPACDELLDVTINNPDQVIAEFRERCQLAGNQVRCIQAGEIISGLCQGIEPCGGILIQTGEGDQIVRSGEVHQVRLI